MSDFHSVRCPCLRTLAVVATFALPSAAQHTLRIVGDEDGRRNDEDRIVGSRSLSSNGRWLVFSDDEGVYLRDNQGGSIEPVSIGYQGSLRPGVSAVVSDDGAVVAFFSTDDQLVPGDTNQWTDLFAWQRITGQVKRVSVDSNGNQTLGNFRGAVVSGDGSTVAFSSFASDLVPGDTNGYLDFFIHHLASGLTLRVSEGSNGEQGWPTCFQPGSICLQAQSLDISDDGRFVAFASYMSNLVPNDQIELDVFVHDWYTRTTVRVSEAATGGDANGWSQFPSLSGDGRWLAFYSDASNLVAGAPNGLNIPAVFLHDLTTGLTQPVGLDPSGNQYSTYQPVLSRNGGYVAYVTFDNVAPDDLDGDADLYLERLSDHSISMVSRGVGAVNLPWDKPGWNWFGLAVWHTVTNTGQVMFSATADAIVGEPSSSQTPFTVVLHDPSMRTSAVSDYCTAKTNSLGCVPRMTVCGAPSMSAGQRFALIAENVRSHKTGFLVWSTSSLAAPFDGGTLCIGTPRRRTPAQDSGGASGADDCTGAYSFWFDPAYVTSVGLSPGDAVYAQYYSRDPWPFSPNNSGLTNAIRFVVLP
ncbi:MAG: hypothetical protein RL277_1070 [Planctomycetota bacterium]|jgi:Tol biopolymer transport system component